MKVMTVPPENDSNRYLSLLSDELERQDVNVIEYSWNSIWPLLAPIITGQRPDVIHIHWMDSLTIGPTWFRTLIKGVRTPIELLIARLLGVNIIWTVHNLTAHDQAYPHWDLLCRIIVANGLCDHLIVHCESAKEAVQEKYWLGATASITVIPHGNYINEYPEPVTREGSRAKLGIEPGEVVFTFFGEIREYKQVPRLIDTYSRLKSEHARLMIVGSPNEASLRDTVLERCEGRNDVITRLEFVPDDEVSYYLKATDIVVLPYQDILTSGTAILALSFARPVIVPHLGCLPELVTDGDSGFLYDPEQQGGLEQAMERALNANLLEMGGHGYEMVKKLNWGAVAEQTRRVYES